MALAPTNGSGAPKPGEPDLRRIAPAQTIYVNRGQNLGGILPDTVSAILSELRNGWLERWVDLSGWMVRYDGHLRSIYYTRRAAIAGAPFVIEPPANVRDEDRAIAAQGAEFITRMLDGQRDLERLFLQLLDGIGRCVSVAENIYTRDSGAWVVRPEWLHTRRFRIAPDYSVRLWDQGSAGGANGKVLDPGKFIIHAPCLVAEHIVDSGELLSCVWWWLLKQWARRDWSSAAERFGSPRAVGTVPVNAPSDVRAALLAGMERFANDSSVVVEEGSRIEVQDPKAAQSADMWEKFVKSLDEEMSKALLGATDITGPGENGSRSAVETRNGVRLERAQSDAKVFAGTLERDLFGPVLAVNAHLFGGKVPPTPRITFELADAPSPQTAIYQYHLQGGIVTRNEVRQQLGLDALSADRGGDKLLDLIPGGDPNAQAAAGGAGAASPLPSAPMTRRQQKRRSLSQMKLPISTGTPSPTRSASPSPLARALSGQSAGRSR